MSANGYSRSILDAFLRVIIFACLAKAVGATKELVIAYFYGTSQDVNTYVYVFTVATWPVTIVGMCAGTILVPLLVELEHRNALQTESIYSGVLGVGVIASGLSVVGVASFLAFSSIGGETIANSWSAMSLGLPTVAAIPFGILSALLAARLIAYKSYAGTLFEAIPAAVLITFIFLFSKNYPAPLVLGWGTFAGFLLYSVALWRIQPNGKSFKLPSFSNIRMIPISSGHGVLIVFVAQIVFSFGGTVIDQLLAAKLPQGSNAVLGYANRVILLVTSLGAVAIGRATLPIFSQAILERPHEFYRLIARWSLVLFFGGITLAVGITLGSSQIIRLLFLRGNFSESDSFAVSEIFEIGVWQFPFYFCGLILAQAISSSRKYGLLLVSNLIAVCAKFIFIYWDPTSIGLEKIMRSNISMYLLSTLSMGIGLTIMKRKSR